MKATQAQAVSVVPAWVVDYAALIKHRITGLVIVATVVGFYIGHAGAIFPGAAGLLLATTAGMVLLVGGANAINQLIERRFDARMERTADRPLVTGRLSRREVLLFGGAISCAGLALLFVLVNAVCAVLAAVAWCLYILAYTPLKRVTTWSLWVGAIPGAMPPVIGWSAATGAFEAESLLLFGIIFLWQIPHFLAIAWLYREDYASAGFRVVPAVDPTGRRTVIQMIAYSLLLIPLSLLPTFFGLAGYVYYVGAMTLGFAFLAFALEVARLRSRLSAQQHFHASLAYLALLFTLMVFDKTAL